MTNARKNCIKTAAALLILAILLGCTACAKEPEAVPEGIVRIGVLEPMTGDDAEKAKAELDGIALAYELHPTVGDLTVELVYADNESSLKKDLTAAESLVQKGCSAVIGSCGNMLTLAASDTFEAAHIPLLNVTGTNPLLTGSSSYLFRTATVETDQAEAAAKYFAERLMIPEAAILLPEDDDYAEEMAARFADYFGREIRTVRYVKGTKDFSSQIVVLRSCGVGAVYLTGNAADTAEFLAQAKAARAPWVYFGTQNLKTDAFLEMAGLAANGLYTTGDWDPLIAYTAMSEEFLAAYRIRYGETALPPEAAALGYEAYMLLRSAIERAGTTDGDAIRSALYQTEAFPGVTGTASMDKEGDLNREQTVWMVANGTFVNPLTYVEPKYGLDGLTENKEEEVFLTK